MMAARFDVVIVDAGGRAWGVDLSAQASRRKRAELAARDEAARIAAVKAGGAAGPDVGPYVVGCAPARGPVVEHTETRIVSNADGTQRVEGANHLGRRGLRRADAFDRMAGKLTEGQIAMGRDYRALVERYAASGVRGMSLETIRAGQGGGGDFMEAVLQDRARLELLHRRIGAGVALEIRRIRPGSRRRAIPDRRLVDAVCLEDRTISEVLAAHGWDVHKQDSHNALVAALAGALDRMQGPVRRPRRHVFLGQMPAATGEG